METATFSVPLLEDERDGVDLSNAVIGLSGVAGVRVEGHDIHVEYDPHFADPAVIRNLLDGGGYPTDDGESSHPGGA